MHRLVPIAIFTLFLVACTCEAETDEELCGDRDCGSATLIDRCGEMRDVHCGSCELDEECEQNQCVSESDDNGDDPCDDPELLCEKAGIECGQAQLEDSCSGMREVDCGDCTSPDECDDGVCVCVGEDDEELCEDIDPGQCGEVEVVDVCGEERRVECESCAEGDSTFGAVRDGESGEFVEDALIRIYKWPPTGGEHYDWEWKEDWRADDPDFMANTGDSAGLGDANYEFTSEDAICVGDAESASLRAHQWYRIRLDAPGYDSRIVYRKHRGYDHQSCPSDCRAADESGCHRMDFELWPQGTARPLYPDLMVDERDLEDHRWQCALMPDEGAHDHLIGLRVTTAVANVGEGPFHLHGTPGEENDEKGQVYQLITHSDGTVEERPLESDFFDYHAPRMPNFMAWVRMGLVEPVDECRDVDDRPQECLSHDHEKLSFCLYDSDRFDGDIKAAHDGLTSLFTNPPVCDDKYDQGTTQGWKDTYGLHLPDQAIMLGPPEEASTLGERWIEVEFDPRRMVYEGDRSNNAARTTITVPSDVAELCDDPSTTLDCTGASEQWDTVQRRQCPAYLDAAD